MKIGLYNRYLATLGGGERHSLAIAAHLSRDHDVTVISHTPVTPQRIAAAFDLDLARVRFEVIPEQPASGLAPVAARYDFFINASNLDFVPPAAPRNAMLVFFPLAPPTDVAAAMRRAVAQRITQWARLPRLVEGVYGEQRAGDTLARGLAQVAEIDLPTAGAPYALDLALAPADPMIHRGLVYVDGDLQSALDLVPGRFTPARVTIPSGNRVHRVRIAAEGAASVSPICLYLAGLRPQHVRYRAYVALFEQHFPEVGIRLRNLPPIDLLATVAGYDLIWANSCYTQRWIKTYWGLDSVVLYAPVEVERFRPGHKQPHIISVGRFFAGSHNKKHLVMIQAFKALVDAGLTWELHLAGGATPGAVHAAYLARVQAAAAGYPIHVHVGLPFPQLADLYARGSIYWHASGYGENERRAPIKFEHFGIATVEAMAAACAPVVIGRGGQTELVTPGENGFLWYTTHELQEYTRRLIDRPELLSRLAQAAMVTSRRFGPDGFAHQLDASLHDLL